MGIGSLLLGSGYLIAKTDRVYEGHLLAVATSTVLTAAMGQRFLSTGKFMPAGLLTVIGVVALGYNGTFHAFAPEITSESSLTLCSILLLLPQVTRPWNGRLPLQARVIDGWNWKTRAR